MARKKQKRDTRVEEEEKILFEHLSDAFKKTGIEVRLEKGDFKGGMCKLKGEKTVIFLNKKNSIEKINNLLITELKSISDYQHYLPPLLRQKIEEN
jgi:hypothetical protein